MWKFGAFVLAISFTYVPSFQRNMKSLRVIELQQKKRMAALGSILKDNLWMHCHCQVQFVTRERQLSEKSQMITFTKNIVTEKCRATVSTIPTSNPNVYLDFKRGYIMTRGLNVRYSLPIPHNLKKHPVRDVKPIFPLRKRQSVADFSDGISATFITIEFSDSRLVLTNIIESFKRGSVPIVICRTYKKILPYDSVVDWSNSVILLNEMELQVSISSK